MYLLKSVHYVYSPFFSQKTKQNKTNKQTNKTKQKQKTIQVDDALF